MNQKKVGFENLRTSNIFEALSEEASKHKPNNKEATNKTYPPVFFHNPNSKVNSEADWKNQYARAKVDADMQKNKADDLKNLANRLKVENKKLKNDGLTYKNEIALLKNQAEIDKNTISSLAAKLEEVTCQIKDLNQQIINSNFKNIEQYSTIVNLIKKSPNTTEVEEGAKILKNVEAVIQEKDEFIRQLLERNAQLMDDNNKYCEQNAHNNSQMMSLIVENQTLHSTNKELRHEIEEVKEENRKIKKTMSDKINEALNAYIGVEVISDKTTEEETSETVAKK